MSESPCMSMCLSPNTSQKLFASKRIMCYWVLWVCNGVCNGGCYGCVMGVMGVMGVLGALPVRVEAH
jgi:hypothetical protein